MMNNETRSGFYDGINITGYALKTPLTWNDTLNIQ